MQRDERSARKGRFPEKWRKRASQVQNQLKMMLRQTVVLQRRTAKLFNDASKALHKHIHIFRLCLIHPHCVRCDFMASIRAFTLCRAQGPSVHKSFKTVSQLLENPYLYLPCKRGVPFPVCLLPQSSTYRRTSQDQAPYTPSLCEARFPSGPQVLS